MSSPVKLRGARKQRPKTLVDDLAVPLMTHGHQGRHPLSRHLVRAESETHRRQPGHSIARRRRRLAPGRTRGHKMVSLTTRLNELLRLVGSRRRARSNASVLGSASRAAPRTCEAPPNARIPPNLCLPLAISRQPPTPVPRREVRRSAACRADGFTYSSIRRSHRSSSSGEACPTGTRWHRPCPSG